MVSCQSARSEWDMDERDKEALRLERLIFDVAQPKWEQGQRPVRKLIELLKAAGFGCVGVMFDRCKRSPLLVVTKY